ncbi:hypothetical protein [Streptomyces sp. NL15-2K]|nr:MULTISPECIES: hypothetical protein [Actinomycetes]WKX06944.1 hypothetical protein Q4V64_05315 [Kutzneria buriramensis]
MSYPRYQPPTRKRPSHGTTSPVTYLLLMTVPAVVAVAALRPR